jgi:DNA-binding NarL/FixJ family response regulator
MASTATAGTLRRRRVIQRPRLLALLDESTARIRTLVAPAGYGKTTLAEQWVGEKGRRRAWFTARRSSTDVAALALGLARASTDLVSDCDVRLREHLRALSGSTPKVDVLAEILAEDFDAWPSDGWLVVDDYHEIVGAEEAELLVSTLVEAAPIQLLIASRLRPSWVSARRILYDEVLELNQTTLAMDAGEASEVLAGRSPPSASGLVALANGWPAVIGLAGVTSAEIDQTEHVPDALYRFFAEEVFEALDDEVKAGLATLAVAPIIDRDLATELLGQQMDRVTSAAIDVGILVERGAQLELHPLARSFLEERCAQLGFAPESGSAATSLEYYRCRGDWDAAFEVVSRHHLDSELERLLVEALDELLVAARLTTVEAWCTLADDRSVEALGFSLARAEVALRRGHLSEAQAYGETAASEESEFQFRAFSIAGRAAHLASREEQALELYRRAGEVAPTHVARRDALWGQLICAVELELPQATSDLRALTATVSRSDTREIVQAATFRLGYGTRFGSVDLTDADAAYGLLSTVDDPLVVSSFQSVYSWSLGLAARYRDALRVGEEFRDTATRYRFDFAMPCAGLRMWKEADTFARNSLALSQTTRDLAGQQHSFALYLRVLAQQRRQRAALGVDVPPLGSALPGARAEVLAARALVLVSLGRVDEARRIVREVQSSSLAVVPTVLVAAVRAISGLKRSEPDAIELVIELEDAAFTTGAVDLLVTAYRSTPDLLPVLLRASQDRERLGRLLKQVGDEDLAVAAGDSLTGDDHPKARLSSREYEVYQLVGQGLTNLQIAQLLFISEATVKLHVHHIYDKLGIRSRTAVAVQAALDRADQATSAIDPLESESDS